MEKTVKLFEQDVYLKQCTATIIHRIKNEDKNLIILDKSLFFPTGGGQPCDFGTIDDAKVLDVYIDEDVIYHVVDQFPAENEVHCVLDWDRRFDHMQQHCGEHILSGVFLSEYGIHNKGFHLGEDYVAVDMDIAEISESMIETIETKANKAIWENIAINIDTVASFEDAKQYPLRKIPEIQEDIRIVTVGSVDMVACCGTHPSRAGEVGAIKVIKWQKNKAMTRVFFYCGGRALKDYQEKHAIINKLNIKYSSEASTLLSKIETESRKKQLLLDELSILRKSVAATEADRLIISAQSMGEGDPLIVNLYQDHSTEGLQLIAGLVTPACPKSTFLLGSLSQKSILMIAGNDASTDCGKTLKELFLKEPYNTVARGGGSRQRAQGTFTDEASMIAFFSDLQRSIK